MAERVALSDEQLALGDIADHHRDLESSLTLYFSESSPTYAVRFAGYASQEVGDELGERLDEADLSSSLTVLAAVEAAFRIDYLRRCYKKKKDSVSLALRAVYRKKEQKASLEDVLIDLQNQRRIAPDHFFENVFIANRCSWHGDAKLPERLLQTKI